MKDFKDQWAEECKLEGGHWCANAQEDFQQKRAILFDAIGFPKSLKIATIIVLAYFVVPFVLFPVILFKGAADYLIIIAFSVITYLLATVVWKQAVKDFNLTDDEETKGGSK